MAEREQTLYAPQETIAQPEAFNGSFRGKDIISVEQFTRKDELEHLFRLADRMRRSVERHETREDMRGQTAALLFYQPSTRTFTSFFAAAQRLGALTIPIPDMKPTSVAKGESLEDTIRAIYQTTAADIIVLRHPEDDSSQRAAACSKIPIINAGSGKAAHPTQAILDIYTIRQELGRVDNLNITMIGDLANGRTVKSLAKLLVLAGKDIRFNFLSPASLRMPAEHLEILRSKGFEVSEGELGELQNVVRETDVLYVTRVQKEWFTNEEAYRQAVRGYEVNRETLGSAKPKMIVMHPLPRVEEIDKKIDNDPRIAYFRQMRNGLYTRMALLAAIQGGQRW
ncbi:MAG: aspartate carbamoyltransferase [Candidatus Shapirobacteria bacterium]